MGERKAMGACVLGRHVPFTVCPADLDDAGDREAVVALTDAYARDPMGGGRPLADDVRAALASMLRAHPGARVLLAFEAEEPVGVLTGVVSLTTFRAAPLFNVHDVFVADDHRGRGVGRALLDAAEDLARKEGCARMSLEVLDHNPAKRLYQRAGFAPVSEYWTKDL